MSKDISYLRREFLPALPAPVSDKTAVGWIRKNLFATPLDGLMTVVFGAVIVWFVLSVFDWLFGTLYVPGQKRERLTFGLGHLRGVLEEQITVVDGALVLVARKKK